MRPLLLPASRSCRLQASLGSVVHSVFSLPPSCAVRAVRLPLRSVQPPQPRIISLTVRLNSVPSTR